MNCSTGGAECLWPVAPGSSCIRCYRSSLKCNLKDAATPLPESMSIYKRSIVNIDYYLPIYINWIKKPIKEIAPGFPSAYTFDGGLIGDAKYYPKEVAKIRVPAQLAQRPIPEEHWFSSHLPKADWNKYGWNAPVQEKRSVQAISFPRKYDELCEAFKKAHEEALRKAQGERYYSG